MIKTDISLEDLNATSKGTMIEHLGMEYLEMGDGFVRAKMPVDERTWQPYRILHGGASIALAETVASVGSAAVVDLQKFDVRGASVSANHLGAASKGYVYATANLIHRGKMTHVWDVKITDEKERNISVVRMTIMIIPK
jgi:1,4-dihydroxy-2-naphthoyl-CoA hydrolase